MKKIIKLFLVLMIILSTKEVFAQDQYELIKEEHKEIYYSRYGKVYASYPFTIFRLNDIYAYCIEPGKHITTYDYVEGDLDPGYNDETKEKLELIGYYGREYPGHDNIRYSMAAQALVWELTGSTKVTFWTKKNEEGEEIDVTKERNEIMNLVNNHKVLPSFKSIYNTILKHEIIIEDSNNVLSNYEVVDDSPHKIYIDGNKIHIIPQKTGIHNIKLIRKNYSNQNTIIFVGKDDGSTQKMAKLHYSNVVKKEFALITEGARLVIHKVDENNNPIKVSNIKFKIRNTKGSNVCPDNPECIYTTNEDGIFITNPLDSGEYEIEELEDQIIEGYTWNKNKVKVVINEESDIKYNDELNSYIDVNFVNESVKGSLEINKKGEIEEFIDNEIIYKENDLSNIEFDIYKDNDIYIDSIKTNEQGNAKVNNLELGNYYLLEKTKSDKYIEKEKINFEIKQTNQYDKNISVNLNIKNILKKGKLEFHKLDKDTNEGIPNTIIEIYKDDKLVFTKETDESGQVIINNLPYGKYYIIEKEANSIYMITNEKVYFEIKEDGEVVKANLINEKIEVPVEKTNTNEDIIAHSLFGIVFLIGIGRMYYERKISY